jgi:putative membrane protein
LLADGSMKTASLHLVPSLVAVLAACGGDQAPANAPAPAMATTTDVAPATTTLPAAATAAAVTAAPATTTPPASAPPATLTDEQILQVAHSADLGEIEQGTLALTKAKDARVKKLAKMMVSDHTAADTKGMALGKKNNLTPAASPVSTSLESDAQAATSTLKSATGADFDKAYVDAQVKEHQAVLDTIDQKLAPAAKNADLKAFLADVRPKIATHLQHAEDLQKAMQK